jgi:tRNA A58 N-methylase Trm61
MTTTAAAPSATDLYALGRDPTESARLQRQSEELRPDSAALLDRVGLGPGQAAIDLGCGPAGIIELLSERVSPGGRVVGLDADPAHVAMARELARQHGLGNVAIVAADARRTGLRQDRSTWYMLGPCWSPSQNRPRFSPRWSG